MSREEIGIMFFETLTTLMTMPELQDSKPILNSSILTEFLYKSPEDVRQKATLYLNKLLSQLYTTDSYGFVYKRFCTLRDSVDVVAKVVGGNFTAVTSMLAHVDDHFCPLGFSRAIMNKATLNEMVDLLGLSFTTSNLVAPNTYRMRRSKGISGHPDRNCERWFEVNGKYHLLDVLIMTWWNHGILFNHQNQQKFIGSFSLTQGIWLSKEVMNDFYIKLFMALYVGHVEIGPIVQYTCFPLVLPLVLFTVQRAHKAIEATADLLDSLLLSKRFPPVAADLIIKYYRPDYQDLVLKLFSINGAAPMKLPDYKLSDPVDALSMTRFIVDDPTFEEELGISKDGLLEKVCGDFRAPPQVVSNFVNGHDGEMIVVMGRQPRF